MSDDRTLSLSTVTAIINAPFEKVNIADWLFNLPDAEYQRCSHAHIAAGTTTTDDGFPMSLNVETIGDALMVQHYVGEIRERSRCVMVSISDAITAAGRTKVRVVWELSVAKIDDKTCQYSNHIHASATDEFLDDGPANASDTEPAKPLAVFVVDTPTRADDAYCEVAPDHQARRRIGPLASSRALHERDRLPSRPACYTLRIPIGETIRRRAIASSRSFAANGRPSAKVDPDHDQPIVPGVERRQQLLAHVKLLGQSFARAGVAKLRHVLHVLHL